MAEITTPPVLVSDVDFDFASSSIGPVEVGPDLYVALQSFGGLSTRFQVLKSSDGGATWARVDAGGGTSYITNGNAALFISTGIFFLFGGVNPANTSDATKVDEQSFVYASDTFQGLLTAAVTSYTGKLRAGIRSDDSAVAAFDDSGDVKGVIFNGALGSVFAVEPSATHIALIVDASDVAHSLSNVSGVIKYRTITGAGSVSSSVTIPDVPEAGDPGYGVADAGNLYYPWPDFSGPFSRAKCEVATGATSAPGTASWTEYPVWTTGLDSDSNDDSPIVIKSGADIFVFWINETDAGISRIYSARFNGAGFDAPVVFYDSSLYPPAGSVGDPTITRIDMAIVGGSLVSIITMGIGDGGGVKTFYGQSAGGSGYLNYIY